MTMAWHARVPGVPTHQIVLGGHTISVRFDTTKARASPNAATGLAQWSLDARCSDPAVLPSVVEPGDTAVTTLGGMPVLLHLVGSIDTRLDAAIAATGEKIRFTALQLVEWNVTRTVQTGTNAETLNPITTTSTLTVDAHFAWAQQREDLDYDADTDAVLTTVSGQLEAGDMLEHATYGRFTALEGNPKPLGGIDRVEVKRS